MLWEKKKHIICIIMQFNCDATNIGTFLNNWKCTFILLLLQK